jgi:inner membrane transporter RhtA
VRAAGILVLAMLSVQLGASLARPLISSVGPAGVTALRTAIAATLLLSLWRPRWDRRLFAAVLPYGLSLGTMNLLFYCALARIPLGVAVALEFTGPLAVSLLASRRARDFLWVVLAAAGILLILPLRSAERNVDLLGVVCALGAGGCWAAYIVFGQRASQTGHSGQTTALGMLIAALVALPFGAGTVVAHAGELHVWLVALAVAVCSSALPYTLEMMVLRQLPARTFGILMSLEPAIAALAGLAILGERLSLAQWAAIGCIVVAAAGSATSSDAPPPSEV